MTSGGVGEYVFKAYSKSTDPAATVSDLICMYICCSLPLSLIRIDVMRSAFGVVRVERQPNGNTDCLR